MTHYNEPEVWKDIPDYEGLYQASTLGRIKSLKFNKEKILKPSTSKGYNYVALSKNAKVKCITVHKLIYITFKGELISGLVIDHISGIRNQNNPDNLQQITQRANVVKGSIPKNSTSKYIGVSWNKHRKMWASQININGKLKRLGWFKNELEASAEYQSALNKINNNESL